MGISLVQGDITRSDADAIVNAANAQLLPGGGVSGAIHAAGGPRIAREGAAHVAAHGAVPTGGAALTTGGSLRARYVIHAVGPVWHGGGSGERDALASAYRSSIELADEHGDIETIAFPSISTGIFGFPLAEATPIAIRTVAESLDRARRVNSAVFVLFDRATHEAFERELARFMNLPEVTGRDPNP